MESIVKDYRFFFIIIIYKYMKDNQQPKNLYILLMKVINTINFEYASINRKHFNRAGQQHFRN